MNPTLSSGNAKRILVVDDEKPIRDILEHALTASGFHVRTAADGFEALSLARHHQFDLVITDMVMPGKEGIETILELRRTAPGIKIIAMSGGQSTGTGDFLPLAKTLGASAVLKKPFNQETFFNSVRGVLEPGVTLLAS